MLKKVKKIVFITSTRADFGKLKPLMNKLEKSPNFEIYIFVTGMHTLSQYGTTIIEVLNERYKNVYPFNNQLNDPDLESVLAETLSFSSFYMHKTLAKTIAGLSDYVRIVKPDMLIVHGDRSETLAGAIVGALSNILVAHIEGGEVSETIDESLRHAITKMSHIHFVANKKAKRRVVQLGENKDYVYVIGSADIDIMLSKKLPLLKEVMKKYEIPFKKYSIFIYHPVTTELEKLEENIKITTKAIRESGDNYIVIYPNNDPGSEIIIRYVEKLRDNPKFRVFPSMRFEHFLTIFKNSQFIIGNSSSGIREAGIYKIPAINIGTRQRLRSIRRGVINVGHNKLSILRATKNVKRIRLRKNYEFGNGKAVSRFFKIMSTKKVWEASPQKQFFDI